MIPNTRNIVEELACEFPNRKFWLNLKMRGGRAQYTVTFTEIKLLH